MTISHLGIDEKSFRAAHQYTTTLNDFDGERVLGGGRDPNHREGGKAVANP